MKLKLRRDPSADLPGRKTAKVDGDYVWWNNRSGAVHRSGQHLDGVSAAVAPAPPVDHRCWGQTVEFLPGGNLWVCPCGAERLSDASGRGKWTHRNSRSDRGAQWLAGMEDRPGLRSLAEHERAMRRRMEGALADEGGLIRCESCGAQVSMARITRMRVGDLVVPWCSTCVIRHG